jgi:hypothetical protein
MPQRLRTAFKNKGISLSEDVAVSVEEPGSKWLIIDNDNKYPVREERRKLFIYKPGSPVWQIKEALHLRRQWVPRYEGKYKVNYTHLFAVLYIVNIASVIIWFAAPYLREVFRQVPTQIGRQSQAEPYQLPKIDLALMAIAALTVYMAYRSRRFIPIAAMAACPILAMFIDQMTRAISAARNFHGLSFSNAQNGSPKKRNRLTVPPMPYSLQVFFILVGAVAVLGLGTSWTLKFKRIYLDAWPTDPKLSSVCMRMTASDAKPFYALKFIKDNKLAGNMFNYWTEGGFIAYGQQPDPNTGKTPLQLFMDGRAQAAYMIDAYDRWSGIMAGGSITKQLVENAKTRRRQLNAADYRKIGDWIDRQLKDKVWVVLMPAGQFREPFVRGLEHHPKWRLVFLNNKQKLFVDMRTPQAKKLFDGIRTGKTVYPDKFSRNLIIAHNLLLYGPDANAHKQGLDFAIKAFKLNPSQAAMQQIIYAGRFTELNPIVIKHCRYYLDDFVENKDTWTKQDGYHHRLVAALNAATYLRGVARSQKNTALARSYNAMIRQYSQERNMVIKTKRW